MNALDQLFAKYDTIRSEGTPPQDDVQPQEDTPPWMPPEDIIPTPRPPTPQPEQLAPKTTKLQDRVEMDRLGFKDKKNWNDVRADKQDKAAQLLEQRMHENGANKKLQDRINMPNGGVTFAQDEKGMDAGYGYRSFPGASYDENTGTLYVAGSDSWRSWYDDFTKIPVWGKTTDAERYKQAERAYNDLTQKYGKSVHRVVGHSLGGSVALELAKNKGIEFSRTFGAPVVDGNPFHRGSVERYRHPLDPVSILDRGATWAPLRLYPHSYGGFKGTFDTPNQTAPDHKMLALKQRLNYV
jgi:phage pi2 protein 07